MTKLIREAINRLEGEDRKIMERIWNKFVLAGFPDDRLQPLHSLCFYMLGGEEE